MSQATPHLIVLGAGPGGYIAAFEAATQAKTAGLDLKISIIERKRLGGTCLNAGCIPTKTILKTAHALADIKRSADFAITGLDTSGAQLDLDALRLRKEEVVDNLVAQIEAAAKSLKIEIIEGTGYLLPKTAPSESKITLKVENLEGEESVHTCDRLIIATGSLSMYLPALDAPFVWTSDDALALKKLPESIIIVGGGVMGVEFADAYAHFGVKVTVIELAKDLLPWMDKRVGKTLARSLQDLGVTLRLGECVQSVRENACDSDSSSGSVSAILASGEELSAEVIMSAVGTTPNTKDFGFAEAGVELEHKDSGKIIVDESCATSVPGIYAIGDVIGGMLLAHEAEAEGVIAARAIVQGLADCPICSVPTKKDLVIPSCIYTSPEIASVGMSSACAKAAGISTVSGIAKFAGNGKALALGEDQGFVQILAEAQTGEVLGAQIVGTKAGELIAVITPYLERKAVVSDIADTVFTHPTLSETIKVAAQAACGKLKL